MKKKFIILIMALVLSVALISAKKADAIGSNISETDFFKSTFEYNINPQRFYYRDTTKATPITSLYINEFTIYYQVGYLRDSYYDLEPGTIYFDLEELRLNYTVTYRSPTNSNSSVNDNIVWRVPSVGNSNSELGGSNRFYTELSYNDVFNGVDNIGDLNLDAILPSISFTFYSSKLNDTTIQLNPSIYLSLYTDNVESECNITKMPQYIKSLSYDSSIGDFKALSFDITLYHLPLMYYERLEDETVIRKYLEKNPPIDPNTSYDNIMTSVFGGFADILSIEVFPNITIGLIIGLPLLLGALLIILKFIRG